MKTVLSLYPNAICKKRDFGKSYYIIWNGNSMLGQGKTEIEAWKSAAKNVTE